MDNNLDDIQAIFFLATTIINQHIYICFQLQIKLIRKKNFLRFFCSGEKGSDGRALGTGRRYTAFDLDGGGRKAFTGGMEQWRTGAEGFASSRESRRHLLVGGGEGRDFTSRRGRRMLQQSPEPSTSATANSMATCQGGVCLFCIPYRILKS